MVDTSPAHIREMFDQISPRYDLLNHLLSGWTDVLWRRRAAKRCEGARLVLDVCSGTGDMAFELRRRWDARVVGSDFALRMLRIARAKALDRGLDGPVAFQQADTLNLPFRDAAFDAATVAFGIRNVHDPRRGIREMTRVVRPGGRVVILEFTLPRSALLRGPYLFYFGSVLPRIGRLIARSEIDAYRYLPESVSRWPRPDELKRMMEEAGLGPVTYDLVFGGVAAIHTGVKP